MQLNLDLTSTRDYGMFTDLGNAAVHALVTAARSNNFSWAQTYRALTQLSDHKEFGEATDTEVRECVYDALGFWERGEDFWV